MSARPRRPVRAFGIGAVLALGLAASRSRAIAAPLSSADSIRTAADTAAAGAHIDSAAVARAAFVFADTLRSRMGAWQQVAGHVEMGGTISTWIAYLKGGEPRGIVETIAQPEVGTRRNEYFFEDGVLRVFTSRGPVALTVPAAERRPYELRIAFDAKGGAIGSWKVIGGRRDEVEPSEAAGAEARAGWLRELVRRSVETPR
ncbi:MAG TPA: hypothetical protein VL123_06790 [Candidatus Udaeobacter sp.]|jgi:hypothetical protein|nr:hypothetical protein [Candidatus Udaeobacter sp.]